MKSVKQQVYKHRWDRARIQVMTKDGWDRARIQVMTKDGWGDVYSYIWKHVRSVRWV